MFSSRIAFDGDTSDDSSVADASNDTVVTRNRSRTQPMTPTSSRRGRPTNTPSSPSPQSSQPQTPRSTRSNRQRDESPQPGPSSRPTPKKSKKAPATAPKLSRKQPAPVKKLTPALREIYKLQTSTKLLIPKLPFCRVVREILHKDGGDWRVQSLALEALQEATEFYLTQFFEDAYRCTLHRNQVTLKTSDFVLVRTLRRNLSI